MQEKNEKVRSISPFHCCCDLLGALRCRMTEVSSVIWQDFVLLFAVGFLSRRFGLLVSGLKVDCRSQP